MATMTITTTGPLDARLVVAFGTYLRLGRNANAAEIKAAVIDYVRGVVQSQENAAVVAANPPASFDPT